MSVCVGSVGGADVSDAICLYCGRGVWFSDWLSREHAICAAAVQVQLKLDSLATSRDVPPESTAKKLLAFGS